MSLDAGGVTGVKAARGTGQWVAHMLREVLAPWVCAAVLPPVVGATAGHPWWRGALFRVLTTVFSAGIPYLLILWGVRRGRLTDRHVSRRSDGPPCSPGPLRSSPWSWARVVLHSHTPAQAAVGAVVGALIAAAVMTLS